MLERICGLALICLGSYQWILVLTSAHEVEVTKRFFAYIEKAHGVPGAWLALCMIYVLPFFFGLCFMQMRRQPLPCMRNNLPRRR